jgi:hypothetical protein
MKLKLLIALLAFVLAGGISKAMAGESVIKCSAQAIDTDGKAIILAGVRFYYGKNKDALTPKDVPVKADGTCDYKFTSMDAGTWYFSAKSFTADGAESAASNVVTRTIKAAPAVAPVLE